VLSHESVRSTEPEASYTSQPSWAAGPRGHRAGVEGRTRIFRVEAERVAITLHLLEFSMSSGGAAPPCQGGPGFARENEVPSRVSTHALGAARASHRCRGDHAITGPGSRMPVLIVGVSGFEPPLLRSQSECFTRLSYTPKNIDARMMSAVAVLAKQNTLLQFTLDL
jgi:hypothetical protein